MAGVLDGIIKQEDLEELPQRVAFRDLVEDGKRPKGDKFVRFLPGGRLPEQPGAKDPKIAEDELHRRRLETIERETYQKAFAAGEEAGLALGEQTMEREIARLLPQFESILRQLDGLPGRVFAGAERFLVETAILMTRELLAHELTVDPTEIRHRVHRLLEQAAGRRDIVVRLAPDQAEVLRGLSGFEKLQIESDPDMAPGSVRMESDFGGIEDNLEQQLAAMETGLRSYLQDRLQAAGCEEMATATQNRPPSPFPQVKPFSPSGGQSPAPAAPAPGRNEPPPYPDRPVGLSAIAEALAAADEQEEEGWPGQPYAESVADAYDEEPMEATVVSAGAGANRFGAPQWSYEGETAVGARIEDPVADGAWPDGEEPAAAGEWPDEGELAAAEWSDEEEPAAAGERSDEEEPAAAGEWSGEEEPAAAGEWSDTEESAETRPLSDEELAAATEQWSDEGLLPEEGEGPGEELLSDAEPLSDDDQNA